MKAENELVIRIDPQRRRIRVETSDNGVMACKEIQLQTFFDCIKGSIQTQGVASGILPDGCFHVAMNSDGSKNYCIRHPQLYGDISYYDTEYNNFPLPRLVFGFRISPEGKVLHCRLGIAEDVKFSAETPMYKYPFSNVGGFALCTGNNSLPVYKNPGTLATLPYFLLSLPNNNDSFNRRNNRLELEHRELLHHMRNKEPSYYYTDILVKSGKTLQDFIDGR